MAETFPQIQGKDLFTLFRENFSIVIVIASIIFSWAYFQFSVKALEERVGSIEVTQSQTGVSVTNIAGDIKAINAKLDLIIDNKIIR